MLFLNPLWLFAIAAVGIPVIIHLWNIKSGKTLKVGSITLISAAAKKSSRSLVINNKLLLAVRCLLLVLLALLLSMPVWRKHADGSKTKGWLLIPREDLTESYRKFKPLVDSLTRSGYQFHYFNEDFSPAEIAKALADTTKKHQTNADYWVLIKQLNRQVSSNLPMYVITPSGVNHFKGDRPSIALNLKWKTYTPDDSVSIWIADAWFGKDNSVQVLQSISKPTGTYFTKHIINSGSDNADFQVRVDNGTAVIKLKKGDTNAVAIDTATLKLAIYTDKYTADAAYLKAALQAVGSFSGRKIIVKQYSSAGQIHNGQNWIFWLSDKKTSDQTLKKSANTLSYTPGTVINTDSWIDNSGPFHIAGQADKIALHQLINNNKTTGEQLWADGFGRPVLSRENATGNYHFYTHFNPAWTNLVWDDNFPQWMFRLIFEDKIRNAANLYDHRIMNPTESLPNIIQKKDKLTSTQSDTLTDISHYFWLLLVVLFLLERFMAHYQFKTQPNHG
jgi:hypothetical protein